MSTPDGDSSRLHQVMQRVMHYLHYETPRPSQPQPQPRSYPGWKLAWAGLGVLLALWTMLGGWADGLTGTARPMLAIALLMGVWWVTEAVPISITALVPLVAFPLLGIAKAKDAAAPYADPTVFLFIGAFMLAACMQRWQLHRRLAYLILAAVGSSPRGLLLACMGATWFLSMWVSNTATTLMMFPIVLALVGDTSTAPDGVAGGGDALVDDRTRERFTLCLLLGIAYAASAGGIATLIGTPPNLVYAAMLRRLYPGAPEVSFLRWMGVGLPLSIMLFALIYFMLSRVLFRFDARILRTDPARFRQALRDLGPMTRGEQGIAVVFSLTALLWIFRKDLSLGGLTVPGWSGLLPHGALIHDGTVAIGMAILLFFIPVDWKRGVFLMDRDWYKEIPWNISLLFGGGFALAEGFQSSGLSQVLGERLEFLSGFPLPLMMLLIVLFMTFLTELTSNTATTTVMLPILAATANASGAAPVYYMLPAAFAASCAFMLPVATPPNAVVFASGKLTSAQMARSGVLLNLGSAPLIVAVCYWLAPWILNG